MISPADKNVGGLLLPILSTLRLIKERSWIIKMMNRNLHRSTSHFGSRFKKAFSWGLIIARAWSSTCKKTILCQEKGRSQSHPNLRLLTGISSNKRQLWRASMSLPKDQPEILRLDLLTIRCLPPSASFLRCPKGIRPRSRSSHSLGQISLIKKTPANLTPSKPDLLTRRYLRCSNLSQSWIDQTEPRWVPSISRLMKEQKLEIRKFHRQSYNSRLVICPSTTFSNLKMTANLLQSFLNSSSSVHPKSNLVGALVSRILWYRVLIRPSGRDKCQIFRGCPSKWAWHHHFLVRIWPCNNLLVSTLMLEELTNRLNSPNLHKRAKEISARDNLSSLKKCLISTSEKPFKSKGDKPLELWAKHHDLQVNPVLDWEQNLI